VTRAQLSVLAAVLVTFLSVPSIAVAGYEPPPCPPDQPPPTLSLSDPKGAGSFFATHVLRAKVEGGEVRSFTAPGARIFSQDDASRPELVSDTPGPLTATAVVVIRDTERLPYQDDYSCTTSVATTVELLAPAASVFGNFRRPRYIVPARKLYSPSPTFSFTVKLAKVGVDLSPFTVRARGSSRLKVPGAGAKQASHNYALREFEIPDREESRRCELLCTPVTDRGFAKRIAVHVEQLGTRPGAGGVKITVEPPTGLHFFARGDERFKPTPWGVDVEVLQSGRRLARLRAAGRCDSFGQSSTCRFKTISTKR
jgi:hypothetical protein